MVLNHDPRIRIQRDSRETQFYHPGTDIVALDPDRAFQFQETGLVEQDRESHGLPKGQVAEIEIHTCGQAAEQAEKGGYAHNFYSFRQGAKGCQICHFVANSNPEKEHSLL